MALAALAFVLLAVAAFVLLIVVVIRAHPDNPNNDPDWE